jgi:hypothetical protein
MNRDDIIRMAEEAGVHEGGEANWVEGNRWELFANLVAAAEREACAKVCVAGAKILDESFGHFLAFAIRERGAP